MGGPDPARARDGGASDDVDHARLAAIVRSSRDAIFTKRPDGTITSWNRAAERLYGWTADEIVGRSVDLLAPPDRADEPQRLIARVLGGQPVDAFETQRRRRDGTIVDLVVTISPVLDDTGAVVELSVIGHDISERKRAEASRSEHLRFVEAMDRVNQAIQRGRDLDHVLAELLDVTIELLACDRAALLFPCDPDAPEYTPRLERRRTPDVPQFGEGSPIPRSESTASIFRRALSGDGPFGFGPGNEWPLPADVAERVGIRSLLAVAIRPRIGAPWVFVLHQCDRDRVWYESERELLREIGRRLTDSLSTMLAARELSRSEAMYRRIVDTANEGIWAIDAEGVTTFVNERMAQMLGRDVDEVLNRPAASFIFADDLADHARHLRDRPTGGPPEYDRRFRRADGSELWTHLTASTLVDDDGTFAGVFAMVTDIGDRRRAEEELRQSEEKFATAFRMSPDLVILTRRSDGVILEVNDALEPMLGFTRDEAVGTTTASLGAWSSDDDRLRFLSELAQRGEVRSVETMLRHRDGHLVLAATSGRLLTVNGEPCLLSVVRDITEQRLVELRVQESETKYRTLIEQMPYPISRIDAERRRSYVNPAWERLTGVDATAATGASIDQGFTPELGKHVAQVLADGVPQDVELDVHLPGGRQMRVQYSLAPELDANGNVTGVLAVGLDLTERREAEELRIAQQTAEQASRAKSAFIASMSHEIRTPMNAILGFAQLLRNDPALDARQRSQIEVIHTSGEHLVDLVDDVLELSKIEAGRSLPVLAPFDLHGLLAEIEALFAPRARVKGLVLHVERPVRVPRHIVSDEGRLRQILINLVGNAVKFTSTGGVAVSVDHLAGPGPAGPARLVVEVEDTGRGIAEADQARLFGYFEQIGTPTDGESGTGLGLAISRGFARLLGGDLTVRSTLGVGSSFRCEIDAPVAGPTAVRADAPERRARGLAPGERPRRVLVADDSAANRDLLCELLRQVGFEAQCAIGGAEAVAAFADWHPDLVLMDMRMPEVDGREATRRIREIDPGAKVVAVTADVFLGDPGTAAANGVDAVLTKPFRAAALFDVIGSMLGVTYTFDGDDGGGERDQALDRAAAADALAATDDGVRERLQRAAAELDFDEISAIAGELPARLARWLRTHAAAFDAESILAGLVAADPRPPDGPPR